MHITSSRYHVLQNYTWTLSTCLRSRPSVLAGGVQWLRRRASLTPDQSMRDLWRANWHWERSSSVSLHLYAHTVHLQRSCISLAFDNISPSLLASLDYLAGDGNWFHSINLDYVNLCFVILQACKCIFIRNVSATLWQHCCFCILHGILFLRWIQFIREGVWWSELTFTTVKLRTE